MTDLVERLKTATNPDIDYWRCEYRDLCAEAAAEIARLRAAPKSGGWQEMETAPKDGTPFLAVIEPSRHYPLQMMVTWWAKHMKSPGFTNGSGKPEEFIYWMPLPSLPQRTDAGKEHG